MALKSARFKDFGKTQTLDEFPPLGFKLNDEEFACRQAMSGAALLDFVRRADSDSGRGRRAALRGNDQGPGPDR